jgi:transposase
MGSVTSSLTPDRPSLPTDLQTAHAEILSLRAHLDEMALLRARLDEMELLRAQLVGRDRQIRALQAKLDELARRVFGKKSEKLDPRQLRLALDLLASAVELSPEGEPIESDSGESLPPSPRKKSKSHGRRPLPRNLPRRQVVVDLPESEKRCARGHDLQRIGQSVSEKIDFVPASYTVVETVVPRYSCPKCHDGVKSAKAPAQAVEKGLAAEGFIAQVVVSKYADHLPLHRQARILARQGLDFRRSTLCDLVEAAAKALQPIAEELRRQVLSTDYVQTDDTSIVVLEPDEGGSIKGRVWTYLDPLGGRVSFDATRTHERKNVEHFLGGYKGYLQADAYSGYDALFRDGTVIEVGCWAHARRRFVLALEGGEPLAATILSLVQQLYRVEREAGELSFDDRRKLRQERSVPILAEIDTKRRVLAENALPKSPLGDALRYLDNQWTALNRYVHDGRLRPDNNGAESQLRAVAVGRKNWLFAGSMAGAHRAAVLYSLIQSCKLASVEPFAYLRDVLLRVATHPHARIAELTPKAWAAIYGAHTSSPSAPLKSTAPTAPTPTPAP